MLKPIRRTPESEPVPEPVHEPVLEPVPKPISEPVIDDIVNGIPDEWTYILRDLRIYLPEEDYISNRWREFLSVCDRRASGKKMLIKSVSDEQLEWACINFWIIRASLAGLIDKPEMKRSERRHERGTLRNIMLKISKVESLCVFFYIWYP